jgi:transcriptional regulator with XRE-family HTH domain
MKSMRGRQAGQLGKELRRLRTQRKVGLRKTAARIGISATYLSRIETNEEKSPPAEAVIRALADFLDGDFDELMCLAGRIAQEIVEYLVSHPKMPAFLRRVRELRLSGSELLAMLTAGGLRMGEPREHKEWS